MDTKRNTSIVFFVLMGIGFIGVLLYAFIIAPNANKRTLGSTDLVLEIPIQKWNLRYTDSFVPFCEDGNTSIQFTVSEDSNVYSSSDGIVVGVEDNVMSVEVSSSVYIEYFPVSNYTVFNGDFVTKGSTLGRVDGEVLNFRVKDLRNEEYVCPYTYLNDFSITILDDYLSLLEYDGEVCGCSSVNY